jgi:hypothetical protein
MSLQVARFSNVEHPKHLRLYKNYNNNAPTVHTTFMLIMFMAGT